MYQSIDTFYVNQAVAERLAAQPGRHLTQGLWVILTPEQTVDVAPPIAGQIMTIQKPDGTVYQQSLDGVDVRHRVMALHFKDLKPEDVPRLSEIAWQ